MKEYYDNEKLALIKNYLDASKFDLAKELIDEYQILYPNDGMLKYLTVKYYNMTKQFKEAYIYCMDQIGIKFRNDRIMAHFYCEFAIDLIALERYEEAIGYLEYAVGYTNGSEKKLVSKLLILYSLNGDYQNAIQAADKYKNFSNENEIDLTMSKIHFYNEEYGLCIKCGLNVRDSELKKTQLQKKYYILGKAYIEFEDYDNAIESLKKVLIIKNDHYYLAYFLIARLYAMQGNLEEAARMLEEMVKDNHAGIEVNNLLCDIYGVLNNPDRLSNVRKYMNPKEIEYQNGKMCFEQLDFLSAIRHFENYINNHGTVYKKEVLFLLILSRFKAGQYRQCLDDIYAFDGTKKQSKEILRMTYYCKYKLGEAEENPNYTPMQIFNYSAREAANHISGRHLGTDFVKYISYPRLFELLAKDLTMDKINPYSSFDKYELDIDKYRNYIGDFKKEYKTLTVICLPGTRNILTLYIDENSDCDNDLEITNEDLNKGKKTLSRIDKFNQKYSKFVS